jgi:hypothetical protein
LLEDYRVSSLKIESKLELKNLRKYMFLYVKMEMEYNKHPLLQPSMGKSCLIALIVLSLYSASINTITSTGYAAGPRENLSNTENSHRVNIPIPIPKEGIDNVATGSYSSVVREQDLLNEKITKHDRSDISALPSCEKLPVRSVSAIGSDGNAPSNVIDNNLNTRWSNKGIGSWIQLDLGSEKSICSVDIAWYRGNIGRQNNFVISVDRFSGKSSGTTAALEKYDMPEAVTDGRYVRITVNGNNENDWASITEIAVFGSTSPPPGPNQPPTADSKSITTAMGTPVDVTLSGQDPEGKPLTFNVVDQPTHGILSATTTEGPIRYTPNTGYTGPDSFTYTATDGEKTSVNKATVSIMVGGSDAGTNDKFGLRKIYPTKPGGEEWYMNMQDPTNDPRSKPPSMSKNSDGSWRVTDGQVRYGVYTSSGYHPEDVEIDHSVLASRGYMQSPNDWKNVEMTGQVKYNSGGDDEWTWYARGGRHTGNGYPEGCEGSSLKGSLAYTNGQVRWAKEQWHVSYVFQPWKNSPASADGKFVGFKTVLYNMELNGKTVVKFETYVDPNNSNQWQKVYDFIDQGGWGDEGGECNGAPDQIITWGGPIATFRWDDGDSIDIKNLSVREIIPPT